jgi:nicotinamide-nucleotide adenylyltransferase
MSKECIQVGFHYIQSHGPGDDYMIALFIGRFQPFHNAHLSDVKEALKKGDEIIIAIGSSQESHTQDNPFSLKERKEIIHNVLKENHISEFKIISIPDINNDGKWVDHVKSIIPNFDIVYTGNELTERLFREKGYEVNKIKLIPNVSATKIRDMMIKDEDWEKLVPNEVVSYIKKIDGVKRVKGINKV